MKDMSYQNKKGVSEIISYVILIIIAVSIGAIVFTYLSNLVPKDRPECNEGLSLSVEEYACKYVDPKDGESHLNLTVKNRGRFNIEAAYIRIGNIGNKTGYWINSKDFEYGDALKANSELVKKQYFFDASNVLKNGTGSYALQIQLAGYDEKTGRYAACPNSITQTITCK